MCSGVCTCVAVWVHVYTCLWSGGGGSDVFMHHWFLVCVWGGAPLPLGGGGGGKGHEGLHQCCPLIIVSLVTFSFTVSLSHCITVSVVLLIVTSCHWFIVSVCHF